MEPTGRARSPPEARRAEVECAPDARLRAIRDNDSMRQPRISLRFIRATLLFGVAGTAKLTQSLKPADFRLEHDPEKWVPVFPRDKRGTRLRGDHAQTKR